MRRDSVAGTFLVALVLCVVCSVLVSAAAVGLRKTQEENKDLFRKRNILQAAGLYSPELSKDDIKAFFGGSTGDGEEKQTSESAPSAVTIETQIIDLESGKPPKKGEVDAATFDQKKAAKDPKHCVGHKF